jgi:hypothetical protein
VILALVSLNALAAGYGFMAQPDGTALGIPQAWLEGTPFADYFIPGALLATLGVLYGVAAFREGRGAKDAWLWAGASGVAKIVWIAVQVAMMGATRHPIQTILQATILAAGIACGLLALSQMRSARRPRSSGA